MIGCGRVLGTPVQLLATAPGDSGAGPCLRIVGLPGGARGCGYAPSERVPAATEGISGEATVRRGPGQRLELYGETTGAVRRVSVSYRLPSGSDQSKPASLIRVRGLRTLRSADIRKPFGYFVAAVPARASYVSATARNGSGAPLDRFNFDRLAAGRPTDSFVFKRLVE